MSKLFLVPIEPIETRYTKHWWAYLPDQLRANVNKELVVIDHGYNVAPENSAGGFFNFAFTSEFKSRQVVEIAKKFANNEVQDGDVFLFTDYWNPGVAFVRYMAAMGSVNIKIVGICHAGLWDPADMLSQKFGGKAWGVKTESMLDKCYDYLIFATEFSHSLYASTHQWKPGSRLVTGFPMEYYSKVLAPYSESGTSIKKENIVCFPHRKAPEKKYAEFLELAKLMPEYEFVVAMDVCKNKQEYHDLLYRSKVVFSAATQETLGISVGIEALIAECVPVIPDRLSYAEMFAGSPFFYGKQDSYEVWCKAITHAMTNYESLRSQVIEQRKKNESTYFSGTKLYGVLNQL